MKKREFCIILGSALLAAGVSGCKESASKKYSSAQELINKGEYSEAVKKLREITSYEDSSQLLLYASAKKEVFQRQLLHCNHWAIIRIRKI